MSELEAMHISIMQGKAGEVLPEIERCQGSLRAWWHSSRTGQTVKEAPDREYLGLVFISARHFLAALIYYVVMVEQGVVRRPKIYLKDSGIFHSLMAIDTIDKLFSHNKLGASWEGFSLESVCRSLGLRSESLYFWGTHSGVEIDLFWQQRRSIGGVEFKYIDAPRLTKSMKSAMSELSLEHLWIIYPGKDHYKIAENLTVLPLENIPEKWEYP